MASEEGRLHGAAVRAFDAAAPDYDRATGGSLFRLQRTEARRLLERWVPPGARVLDIGCGTGTDAVALARGGREVVACDPSVEMRRLTARRAREAGVAGQLTVLDSGLETLPAVLDAIDAPPFDAIVSNFGALNCVASLAPLGVLGSRHLRPGGSVVTGVLGPTCLWEMAYCVVTGRVADLRRRRNGKARVGGVDVAVWYHSIDALAEALGPDFTATAVRGLGVLVPPPYLEPRWQQVPAPVAAIVVAVDRLAARVPLLRACGDHVLARWQKRRVDHG